MSPKPHRLDKRDPPLPCAQEWDRSEGIPFLGSPRHPPLPVRLGGIGVREGLFWDPPDLFFLHDIIILYGFCAQTIINTSNHPG